MSLLLLLQPSTLVLVFIKRVKKVKKIGEQYFTGHMVRSCEVQILTFAWKSLSPLMHPH